MAHFVAVLSLFIDVPFLRAAQRQGLRLVCVILVGLYTIQAAFPQTTTGLPATAPLQPLAVDTVNQANLNVHLSIPMFSKAGRKLPFSFPLNYDNTTWTPIQNTNGNWSWQPGYTLTPGSALAGSFPGALTVSHSGSLPCNYVYPRYSYTDAAGTTHQFPIFYVRLNPGCPGSTQGTVTTFDGLYTLSAGFVNNVYSITSFTDDSGNQIIPRGNAFNSTGPWSIKDPDGNALTESSGSLSYTFTDTLGMPVLTTAWQGSNYTTFTYTYTGPNSAPETVTLTATPTMIASNFGCKTSSGATIAEYPPTSANLLTSIQLPDGTQYTFQYEQTPLMNGDYTGRISQIGLPTGGTISYTYPPTNDGVLCADGTLSGLTRQTSDGTWVYSRTSTSTTVQDPATNQSVLQTYNGAEVQRQIYQGTSSSGSLLETITTCYNYSSASPCSTLTGPNQNGFLPLALTVIRQPKGGNATQTVTFYGIYDANCNCQLPLPTEVDTYDYGAGSPLQVEKIAYNSSLGNILNRPACVQITAGTNSNACGTITSNTKSLTNYSYFSDGNLQTANSWVSGSTFLSRSYTYFPNGLLETSTDVNTTQTTYGYQNCNNTPAYLSSITTGSLTTSYTWDCNGGVLTQVSDPNSQPTQYGYVSPAPNSVPDPFWRVLSTTDPLGNVTWNTYTAATPTTPATRETALNFNTISTPTSTVDVLSTLDGLGRLVESQRRNAPGSLTFDSAVQYTYGWNSTGSVTGPFSTRTFPGGTALTTTQFDALGRTASVTDGGTGTLSLTYAQNDVLSVVGPKPSGENLKQRQLEYDALGRITSVCEETSTLPGNGACAQTSSAPVGYFTKYKYDSPANTVSVTQNAQPGAIGGTQTRTYTYDGLGRLISELNPETGTIAITYTYDSDGTCGTSNGDLVKKVDAYSNVTCYAYDFLHRKTGITYPSGPYASSTSAKTFVYDATTFSCTNASQPNVKGRLAEAFTGPSTAKITDIAYCYSPRGEVVDAFESTPNSGSTPYHTVAGYWANGILNTLSGVPGLNGWTFTPDGEGRPYSATYGTSTNWVKSAIYYPSTVQTTVTYGNGGSGSGDTDVYSYDASTGRMNGFQFNVGSGPTTLIGSVNWNPNGTLGGLGITDHFNSLDTQTCSYVHDDLARINNVNCVNGSTNVWSQSFTLDAFGNVSKSGNSAFAASYLQANGTINNQEVSVSNCTPTYDANGNLTKDCTFITPAPYAWDADGNAVTLNTTVGVTYDAFDREVEIATGSTHTQVLYSPIGKLGLMNGQTAKTIRVPLPGGSTMEILGGQTHILHSDWLGSYRLSTTYLNRTLVSDTGYAPYGENYAGTGGTTDLNFTGQSQDTLSSLYDFLYRQYSPAQSRWLRPDPAGLGAVDFANPQTLNRYAYVQNGPLNSVDPQGTMNYFPWLMSLGYTAAAYADLGVSEGFDLWANWNELDIINAAYSGSYEAPDRSKPWVPMGTLDGQIIVGGCTGVPGCEGFEVPQMMTVYPNIGLLGLLSISGSDRGSAANNQPSWWGAYAKSLFSWKNFSAGFKEGGCFRQFAEEAFDPAADIAGQDAAIKATAQSGAYVAATAYAAHQGLVVPMRSSIVRGILDVGEVAGEAIALGATIYDEGKALVNEVKSFQSGECQ